MTNQISDGLFHKLPKDMKEALQSSATALAVWESISPIARNEWICWTITVKLQKTRNEHITRMLNDLPNGKRRPCCWVGCLHRTDKAPSAWAQKVLIDKQTRNS